jgi:hypothetical protein
MLKQVQHDGITAAGDTEPVILSCYSQFKYHAVNAGLQLRKECAVLSFHLLYPPIFFTFTA